MAKCIVCSKSAGPFNSLHKSCVSIYRDTEKCLQEKLISCAESRKNFSEWVEDLQACKSSVNFSAALFKELLVNAWSTQATQCVQSASINTNYAKNLLQLAEHFEINHQVVEQRLLIRLINLKTLDRIQNNQTIEVNVGDAPEILLLSEDEKIIWVFKDISKIEQQRYTQEKNWTVLRSVLNNALLKSRYKQLATKTESAGELFVTNRALYYSKNNQITTIQFEDIHSITPMRNGIRIQANTSGATPETFITGDGRFTYALLQYAQRQEV